MNNQTVRCCWCGDDRDYQNYHDFEWGVPCRDDQKLFEFLILESAQAGLSWLTILRKRENYRRAFTDFNTKKVASYTRFDIQRLMADKGIVRNRLKIESAITNPQCFLKVQTERGSFSEYLWRFVDHSPVINSWINEDQIPISTDLSEHISQDMKSLGFKFFGSTICYAYLQAVGVVNDHIVDCSYRFDQA